jgi:hypothetical protein
MWRGGSRVRVARTTKDTQMLVGGRRTKRGKMRTRSLNHRCGKTVLHVRSSVKSFYPKTPEKGSLNQQSVNDIVNRTNSTLPFCGDV